MKKIIRLTESDLTRIVNRVINENQEEVDRILDKISDGGYRSLSVDEKRYLNAFSKHEGRPDDFVDPSEQYDESEKEGEKFTSSFKHIPTIEFVVTSIEKKTKNLYILYGTIQFNNKEYIGGLYLNKLGKLIDFDFYEEPKSIHDNVGRFQDDIEGIENEVTMFFEDEVIPSLIN